MRKREAFWLPRGPGGAGPLMVARKRSIWEDHALRWAALAAALLLGLQLAVAAGLGFGFHAYVIETGSMAPTLQPGALILTRQVPVNSLRKGDVITFPLPADPSISITHRLAGFGGAAGNEYIITRGDANAVDDAWKVPLEPPPQLLAAQVPLAGYLTTLPGRLGLVGLVAWGLLGSRRPSGQRSPAAVQP